jgi:hypothetical protein
MNRRIRNRTYGGVGGRRVRALLLPDLIFESPTVIPTVEKMTTSSRFLCN